MERKRLAHGHVLHGRTLLLLHWWTRHWWTWLLAWHGWRNRHWLFSATIRTTTIAQASRDTTARVTATAAASTFLLEIADLSGALLWWLWSALLWWWSALWLLRHARIHAAEALTEASLAKARVKVTSTERGRSSHRAEMGLLNCTREVRGGN